MVYGDATREMLWELQCVNLAGTALSSTFICINISSYLLLKSDPYSDWVRLSQILWAISLPLLAVAMCFYTGKTRGNV